VIPPTLKIGASIWTVQLGGYEVTDNNSGLCEAEKHLISIYSDLAPERCEQIFLHELLHAVCDTVGIEGKLPEEEFVNRITPTLHAVLKENGFWQTSPPGPPRTDGDCVHSDSSSSEKSGRK